MSATPALTSEEWMRLRQALVYAWKDDYSVRSVVDGLAPTVESIVAAHVRRALEDAADAVKDVRENGLPDGVMSAPYSEHFELWLRARAAAVAPDPRETKD